MQPDKPLKKKKLYLRIFSETSTESMQRLFDYDHPNQTINNTFDTIAKNKFIAFYRKEQTCQLNIVEMQRLKYQQKKGFLFLFCVQISIVNKRVKVTFYPYQKMKKILKIQQGLEMIKQYRDLYFVVRSFKDGNNFNIGYKVAVGQTIKLGVCQYRVNSLKIQPEGIIYQIPASYSFYDNYKVLYCDRYPNYIQKKTEINKGMKWKQKQQAQQLKQQNLISNTKQQLNQVIDEPIIYKCKYCLDSQQTEDNFLMHPCKCSGQSNAVHFQCLKPWIEARVKKQKIGEVLQYNFDKFSCEICKSQLPRFIIMEGKTYDLLFLDKVQKGNFLILEETSGEANRILKISNINQNGYMIGRSEDATVMLTDPTVSRLHSQIKKQQGQFRIYDTKSKFGTLIKQQEMSFELQFVPKMVQIGKTLVQFSIFKKEV